MYSEKEKYVMANDAYKVLKETIEGQDWSYKEDKEKLILTCRVNVNIAGKDSTVILWAGAMPDSMLVQVTSPLLPGGNDEAKYMVAVAVSHLNYNLPVGDFDYDITTGAMVFRIANSYIDSPINNSIAFDMFKTTIDCVCSNYNPLLKLAQGKSDFGDFLSSMNLRVDTSALEMEGDKRKRADSVFHTLCEAVEHRGCAYRKSSDRKAVIFQMSGDHFPVDLAIRVDEERQQLRLLSKFPYVISEDKRVGEGQIATCIASHGLSDSNFDYEFFSGSIFFKVSESFLNRDLSEGLIQYMIDLAYTLVNEYNYKFYQFDQGEIGLADLMSTL